MALLLLEQSEVQIFQIEQELLERGFSGTVLPLRDRSSSRADQIVSLLDRSGGRDLWTAEREGCSLTRASIVEARRQAAAGWGDCAGRLRCL